MAASVSTPGSILMEVIYLIPGKLKINDHLGSLTWKTSHVFSTRNFSHDDSESW